MSGCRVVLRWGFAGYVVMARRSMRSVTATGFSHCGRTLPTVDPADEAVAVVAALFAQDVFAAVWAFVDGDRRVRPGGRDGDRGVWLVAAAARGLASGGAAVGLPADRGEGGW